VQARSVGGEVGLLPRGGAAHLGSLQCWLDDSGDTERDFFLKLEYVFQQPIKTVGPKMRASESIN